MDKCFEARGLKTTSVSMFDLSKLFLKFKENVKLWFLKKHTLKMYGAPG